MAYKVIKHFVDLQDSNHKYDIGDIYPRKGLNVLQSRINELASENNRLGCPLIEEIPEAEQPKKKRKSEKTDEE